MMAFSFTKNKEAVSMKRAFTLPEVIVAMGVLVMVIMSSTNLMVSIVRANTDNVNTLIAYQLAQEGLEGMRNIRDGNWLLNANFNGSIKTKGGVYPVWGATLPAVGQTAYYLLDYNDPKQYLLDPQDSDSENAGVKASEIHEYAPWKLFDLGDDPDNSSNNISAALFFHKFNQQNDGSFEFRYLHTPSQEDAKSIFSRYLKIEALGYGGENNKTYKYRVTSVVRWNEANRSKELSLTTELTDWKGGAV